MSAIWGVFEGQAIWIAAAIGLALVLSAGRNDGAPGKSIQGLFAGGAGFFICFWSFPLFLPGLGDKSLLLSSLGVGALISGMVGWTQR